MNASRALLLGGFFFALPASAQSLDKLVSLGYSNLAVSEESGALTLWYENQAWFSEWEALKEILRSLPSDQESLTVVIQHQGIPWVALRFAGKDLQALRQGAITGREFAQSVQFVSSPTPSNTKEQRFLKTDLRPCPHWEFTRGNFYTFLNLDAETVWSPGWQTHFRLQGELSGTYPTQLTEGTLGYYSQSHGFYGGLQAGLMGVNSLWKPVWGWNGEMAYPAFEDRLIAKFNLGQRQNEHLQAVLSLEGWAFPLELGIAGGYGFFPDGDGGPFARITRRFSRSELSLEGAKTGFGTLFRISLGMDLWPGRYPHPQRVRLTGPSWIEQEYRSGTSEAAQRRGPQFQVFPGRLEKGYLRAKMAELSPQDVQYDPAGLK